MRVRHADLRLRAAVAVVVFVASSAAAIAGAVPAIAATSTIYLSDLEPVGEPVNGLGPYERDRSNGMRAAGDGGILTIGGKTYAKGLGTRARSDLRFRVPAGCTSFSAEVGIDDEVPSNRGLASFQVWKGSKKRLAKVVRSGTDGPLAIAVPLQRVSTLRLLVTAGPDGTTRGDSADWADAKLTCGPVATGFDPAVILPAGTFPHSVVAADLNADARMDIVTANTGSDDVRVLLRQADGSYSGPQGFATGDQPKSVAVGDVNGDGWPDLVTADQGTPGGISVLLGKGDGTFEARVAVESCSRAHEATIADLNGDGHPDLAVACWGGSVMTVVLGDGTGAFPTRRDEVTGTAPHSVVAGDFDGDGRLDLAAANHDSNNVSVLLGLGDGTFLPHVTYAVGTKPHSIRAGDLDGDGLLDLAVANDSSDTVTVLRGAADGTFLAGVSYGTGQTPKSVALADVDRDGRLDVVTSNIRGNYPTLVNPGGDSVSVLRGTGGAAFAPKVDYAVGSGPFGLALRDVNGDGIVDLLTANWHDGTITLRNGY